MSGSAVGREVLCERDVHGLGIVVEEEEDQCDADRAAIEARQIEERRPFRAECRIERAKGRLGERRQQDAQASALDHARNYNRPPVHLG